MSFVSLFFSIYNWWLPFLWRSFLILLRRLIERMVSESNLSRLLWYECRGIDAVMASFMCFVNLITAFSIS